MKKASLALATTALAGSLCVIGSTIATADESTANATNTSATEINFCSVSYTHLRAHETN